MESNTFVARSRVLERIGVPLTVAGGLMALVGDGVPWARVLGGTVQPGWLSGPFVLLGMGLVVLAIGRYVLPQRSDTLAVAQALLGVLGLLLAFVGFAQIFLLGSTVSLELGGLVTVAGFGLATAAAWRDRN